MFNPKNPGNGCKKNSYLNIHIKMKIQYDTPHRRELGLKDGNEKLLTMAFFGIVHK